VRKRLGLGGAISLVAAILLFVFTFFQWYGRPHSGPNPLLIDLRSYGGGTAWQTLGTIPLVLLMLAVVVAVGATLLRLGGSTRGPAILPGIVVGFFGLLAAVVTLAGIRRPPGVDLIERIPMGQNIEAGTYLALAATLGVAYGGWRSMREEAGVVTPHLESAS
jgi:hypothetical protein